MSSRAQNPYRLIPSVEHVLGLAEIAALEHQVGRDLLVRLVQSELDAWREEVRAGLDAGELERRLSEDRLARAIVERVQRERRRGLVPVVNATGIVLHTGLGRAPVHPEVAAAMERVARSYCVLEVDRETGERNHRDGRLGELLARLTGAEAGIGVNNNAAAMLLALQTFAAGRETLVSRGELVEIGGSFRMPDVMERAGTRLVEVGTTNRTRIGDYRAALRPETGLLLKVHTSNFRLVGFVEEVGAAELGELGRQAGVPSVFDLGSGLLECEGTTRLDACLGDEPLVRAAVASGVDVVTFSGDKLLGGPQAGLLVGRREALAAMRKNPIYRALRLDKVTLAGLERTLELLLAGRGDELPTRAMLRAGPDELWPRAERIATALDRLEGFTARVALGAGQPGSGSAPGVELPGFVVRVRPSGRSVDRLAHELRAGDPPVFARIHEDELVLDPRTLLPGDEDALLVAFRALADRSGTL